MVRHPCQNDRSVLRHRKPVNRLRGTYPVLICVGEAPGRSRWTPSATHQYLLKVPPTTTMQTFTVQGHENGEMPLPEHGLSSDSFAESALHDHYFRETALINDFLAWRQTADSDFSRLPEFGMTITGEVDGSGVSAVLRHKFGGIMHSGPVMLNTNNENPYSAALVTACQVLLAVGR